MLDPITSLLAACVNCNPPDSSAVQPDVAVCTNNPRSSQNAAQQHAIQQNSLSGCISSPESISASSRQNFTSANAVDTSQRQTQHQAGTPPRPIAPESVVAVSWSSPATNAVAAANPEVRDAANPVLQFGSRGQDVTRLQTQLQQLRLYTGAIDGIFGQQTKAAVVLFQRSKGLQADGVVGAKTWTALALQSVSQSVARQPQSANPTQSNPQNRTQNNSQSNPQGNSQNNSQNNSQGDRPATQSASSAVVAPSTSTAEAQNTQSSSPQSTESNTQSDRNSDSSPQFPFNSFWILGWGIIYGSGWIFILKDTVKEIKGFHFITTTRKKTSKRTTRTVVTHVQSGKRKTVPQVVIPNLQTPSVPVEPAPVSHPDSVSVTPQSTEPQPQATQPVNSDVSDRSRVAVGVGASDRVNQSLNHSVNDAVNVSEAVNQSANQPTSFSQTQAQILDLTPDTTSDTTSDPTPDQSDSLTVTQFLFDQVALADPWQDEVDPSALQVLEVALADGGQILPLQNVFIAPPRSRFSRSKKRPKNPALITNYSYYSYPKPVPPNKPEVVSGHDARDRHQQAKAG